MTPRDVDRQAVVALAGRVAHALDLPSAFAAGRAIDKYAVQSHPDLLRDVAAGMAALAPVDAEVFGGVELAGVPLAAAMSLADGRPFAVVRRAPKLGSNGLTAGVAVAGKRVVLVKDMVRSGAVLTAVAEALRTEGAVVTNVVCAICWDSGAVNALDAIGLELCPLLTLADLRTAWKTGT